MWITLHLKTYFGLSINPLKPSGHYMYRQFNTYISYVLPTQCIDVFCVDLRTNSDYFPMTGFYNRAGECLLRGTDWILKCNSGYFSDDTNCTQLFCIKLDSWPTQNGRLHAKALTALSSVASPSKSQQMSGTAELLFCKDISRCGWKWPSTVEILHRPDVRD